MSPSRYPLFSGAGLIVVAVLLLAVIAVSNTLLQGLRLDLTENRIFTLSPGTRNILNGIGEPIDLYYFISKKTAQGYPQINVYAKRVRDMLYEMTEKANGKLRLHVIDPEPFSNEEDRAVELGLQGVLPAGGSSDALYFGLAGSNSVGQTASIPFFQNDRETLLEYDLSKLVYQLSHSKKPVVGLISTLEILSGLDKEQRRVRQGTIIGQQLRQLFDVRELKPDVRQIPEEVELLMLVHPTELSDAAQYAIDQFVLRGGKALVFADPFSAVQGRGGTPDKPALPASNPERLLKAWGVRILKENVVLDSEHAIRVSADPSKPPVFHFAMLSLGKDVLNQDDVTTRGLDKLNVGFAGSLERIPDSKMGFAPLFTTGEKAMEFSAYSVDPNMDPSTLITGFRSAGKKFVIAARLSGIAETAFPDGPPQPTAEPEAPADDPLAALNQALGKKEGQSALLEQIKQSKEPVNIIVVADTDLLADRIWVDVQDFFGKRVASPWASNGDFVVSAVDNLLGSSDVISIRSRAGFSRPFDRVEAVKRSADAKFRSTELQLQERLKETEKQLNQFQAQKSEGGGTIMTAEQQQTLVKFREDKLTIRKQLREVRRQLDRDIERLGTQLKFINTALVPLLLILGVLLFNLFRHMRKPASGGMA